MIKKKLVSILLLLAIFFFSCKKAPNIAPDEVDIESVWELDPDAPKNDYSAVHVINGEVTVLTSHGTILKVKWDGQSADKKQAFDNRSSQLFTLPYGFAIGHNNRFQAMNDQFLFYHENKGDQKTLKIAVIDKPDVTDFLEIKGVDIDPAFVNFEWSSYYGKNMFRILGHYILAPYNRTKPGSPVHELNFMLLKLNTTGDGIEKSMLIGEINKDVFFGGLTTDIAVMENHFVVSTYGSRTSQTCVIDLNGKVNDVYEITSHQFVYNYSKKFLMGFSITGGIYQSEDSGKTWMHYSIDLPNGIQFPEYTALDKDIIGALGRQLFHMKFESGTLNIKEISNKGLPEDLIINSVFNYGDDYIGLATNLGIYMKKQKDLVK